MGVWESVVGYGETFFLTFFNLLFSHSFLFSYSLSSSSSLSLSSVLTSTGHFIFYRTSQYCTK